MTGKIPHEIIDRASDWLIEMREPAIAPADQEAFAEWLRQSPVHVQAYLEVAGLWGDAAQLDPSRDFGIDEALRVGQGTPNVVTLDAAAHDSRSLGVHGEQALARGSRSILIRLAAALLIGVGVGTVTWWNVARPVYSADVGEQRVLTLEDGSILRLNSRSKLRVKLSPELRQVDLLEGQALFEVARDLARPFIVHSGDISVRAVGTQFDVYWKESGTVVTVVEGQVEIESRDSRRKLSSSPTTNASPSMELDRTGPVFVSAGEQVSVNRSGTVARRQKPNIAAATSWVQQRLIFTGEPLGIVVEEFNRYTRRTIILTDPSLADLHINAVFHSTNPDSLLNFIARYPGVEVVESDSEIRIARREPGR